MIPTSDTTSINTALFHICSMSPSAKTSIELESYRQTVDSDESTNEHILESAFVNLTKDLEAIGLILDIDDGEIFEDEDTMFKFLNLVSYFLPNTLYSHIKTNDRLKLCLHHILDGTLGDNETLVQTYLSELAGLDDQDAVLPDLSDFIARYYTQISQTELFTDYMRNVYQLVNDEKLTTESDAEAHNNYRDRMKNLIVRFAVAAEKFSSLPIYNEVCRIQDLMIKDMIAPVNFTDYNYLFTTDPTTLPRDLMIPFAQRWFHYEVSNLWCEPYYKARNLTPMTAQLIVMYCFLYALYPNKTEYVSKADAINQNHPSDTINNLVESLYQE